MLRTLLPASTILCAILLPLAGHADGGLGGEAAETALFLPVMRQVFAQSQQPARGRRHSR